MARTRVIRAQADAANAMIDRLRIGIDAYAGAPSAEGLSLDLARLDAIMRLYFAIGERDLYPSLMAEADQHIAARARHFQREACTVAGRLARFSSRWPTSSAIDGDLELFRSQAAMIIMLVRRRLRNETRDLFALVDDLTEVAHSQWINQADAVAV